MRAALRHLSYTGEKLVEDLRLELRLRGNRPRVLAAGRILYGALCENRTRPSALPKQRAAFNA